jgi:hypothetical protein
MHLTDPGVLFLARCLARRQPPLATVAVPLARFGVSPPISDHPVYESVVASLGQHGATSEGETKGVIEALCQENPLYSVGWLGRIAWGATLRVLRELAEVGKRGDSSWSRVEAAFGGIDVTVDATGLPVLASGIIPLAVAKVLGLETAPARVVRRDPEWEAFRKHLFAFAAESLDEETRIKRDFSHYGGRLYQQAYHFDTHDIPHVYGPERARWIKLHLRPDARTLLDIGANYGMFCMEFEKHGLDCTAVELKADDLALMRRLRDACRARFSIAGCSIFDFKRDEVLEYDVVLALFIFHHFLKTPELHQELIHLLGRLKCRQLFLGVPDPDEKQMRDAFRNYSPEDFARFVMTHTGLGKFEVIECPGLGNRAIIKIH